MGKVHFFILFAVFLQPLTRRQMPGLPRRGPAVLASLAFLAAEAFLTSTVKRSVVDPVVINPPMDRCIGL